SFIAFSAAVRRRRTESRVQASLRTIALWIGSASSSEMSVFAASLAQAHTATAIKATTIRTLQRLYRMNGRGVWSLAFADGPVSRPVRETPLAAGPAQGKTCDGLGVVDLAGEDQLLDLTLAEPARLDLLIIHRSGFAFRESSCQIDGHALLHIARAHQKRAQLFPITRAVACFLNQLPPGRL